MFHEVLGGAEETLQMFMQGEKCVKVMQAISPSNKE